MVHSRNRGDGGDGDRDRHILTGEINDGIRLRIDGTRDRELEGHVLGLGLGDDRQRTEGGQVDSRQRLRTRAGNDEHLDGGEREAGRTARQEGGSGGSLFLRETVEAGLLAFLREDGAEQGDQRALVPGVGGEDGLGFGQGSEDDIGEGLGEGDGVDEGGDGKLVLTGLDGGVVGACENAVDACGV